MAAADIAAFADDVRRFAKDAPGEAIEIVEQAILDRLRADTGDGTLSRGRGLGRATTRVTRSPGEAIVEPDGSRAVWGILGGTAAHIVRADRGRVLATPYGPRREVRIPRTRGKYTFVLGAAKGIVQAQREIENIWGDV